MYYTFEHSKRADDLQNRHYFYEE